MGRKTTGTTRGILLFIVINLTNTTLNYFCVVVSIFQPSRDIHLSELGLSRDTDCRTSKVNPV